MEKAPQNADGQYVVIEKGQRVTAPTPNQQEAQQEADRRNQLAESQGQPGGKAQVKQNLFGAVIILLVPVVSVCATTFTSL